MDAFVGNYEPCWASYTRMFFGKLFGYLDAFFSAFLSSTFIWGLEWHFKPNDLYFEPLAVDAVQYSSFLLLSSEGRKRSWLVSSDFVASKTSTCFFYVLITEVFHDQWVLRGSRQGAVGTVGVCHVCKMRLENSWKMIGPYPKHLGISEGTQKTHGICVSGPPDLKRMVWTSFP